MWYPVGPGSARWGRAGGARELDGGQRVGGAVVVHVEARGAAIGHKAGARVRDRVAEGELAVDKRGRRDRVLEQRQQVVVGLGLRDLKNAVDPWLGQRALAPAAQAPALLPCCCLK